MRETVFAAGRYGAKGAVSTLANVALMATIVEVGGIHPSIAAIISTALLIPTLGYYLMGRFVFPDGDHPTTLRGHARRVSTYAAVIFGGKAVHYVLFLVLLAIGVWYPVAWVLGSVSVFVGTFAANRRLWVAHS